MLVIADVYYVHQLYAGSQVCLPVCVYLDQLSLLFYSLSFLLCIVNIPVTWIIYYI
jgi:hypothetical protein